MNVIKLFEYLKSFRTSSSITDYRYDVDRNETGIINVSLSPYAKVLRLFSSDEVHLEIQLSNEEDNEIRIYFDREIEYSRKNALHRISSFIEKLP